MVPVMQEAAAQAAGRMQVMRNMDQLETFGQMEILAEEQFEPAVDVWEGLLLLIGAYQYYQYQFQ